MKTIRLFRWWEKALSSLLATLMAMPAGISVNLFAAEATVSRFVVNGGDASRSSLTNLSFAVATNSVLAPDGVQIHRLPSGQRIPETNLIVKALSATNEFSVSFTNLPGDSLSDGRFAAGIVTAPRTNADGPRESLLFPFHRYFGDRDGDGDVDFSDTYWFRQTFNRSNTHGAFDPRLDVDGDGFVGTNDLQRFNSNYFTVLPAASGIFAHLALDDGFAPADHRTSDPTIKGRVITTNSAEQLRIQVVAATDPEPAADTFFSFDATTILTGQGSFQLTSNQLAQAHGSALLEGAAYMVRFQLVETNGTIAARFALPFTIETACPLSQSDGWITRISGVPSGVFGSVLFTNCTMILTEGDSFTVEAERGLTIPTNAGLLIFSYQLLGFDQSASGSMRDAFEASLVDGSGRPLTFAIQGSSGVVSPSVAAAPALPAVPDAFFNHSDGRAPFAAPGAVVSASAVTVDVSHLAAGSTSRLILRLINNDRDRATSLRITELKFKPSDPALNLAGSPPTALSLVLGGAAIGTTGNTGRSLDFSASGNPSGVMVEALPSTGVGLPPVLDIGSPLQSAPAMVGYSLLIAGNALAQGVTPSGVQNTITMLTVNGFPVEAFDAAGNFATPFVIHPGRNVFTVTATDALGQTSSRRISATGVDSLSNSSSLGIVSASVSGEYGRTSFNERNRMLYADVGLRNVGGYPIRPPFYVGVTRISDPSVSLMQPDGISADGVPYYDFSGVLTNQALIPGAQTAFRTLAFRNPNHAQFTYEFTVLGQVNRGPQFTSVPLLNAVAGRPYRYDADATDPDGDTPVYSLVAAPSGMVADSGSGLLTWTPLAGQIGSHEVDIVAADGHGGRAEQKFILTVTPPSSNRPPVFTSRPITVARVLTNAYSEPHPVDLSRWTAIQYEFNDQPDALWVLSDSNKVATQTINADASILLSDFGLSKERIQGTWSVQTASDDDFIGFVFGLQDTNNFYLFDWKQSDQDDGFYGFARRGMSVKRIAIPPGSALIEQDIWPTATTDTNRVQLLYHNSIPYDDFIEYGFTLDVRSGGATINVSQGTNLLDSINLSGSGFTSGRFGFYNDSQEAVRYAGFARQELSDYSYRYSSRAEDPDADPVVFSLVKGPAGMLVEASTGAVLWSPSAEQIGDHGIVLRADDGQGGVAYQNYHLCVLPVEGNRSPVFISKAPTECLPATVVGNSVEVLIPYLSTGYRFKVVANNAAPGFERLDYNDSAFALGDAGFGSGSCDLNDIQFTKTAWPANTDLLIRRIIPLSDRVTGLRIKVALDNDIEVFMNGQNISNGRQTHDGCPTRDSLIFDVPSSVLVAGNNLLAIRAIDRGTFAYFDMELVKEEAPALFNYVATALDPESDAITYKLVSGPLGLLVDAASGRVVWATNQAIPGVYPVSISAEDGKGGSAFQDFSLSVESQCVPSIRGIVWHDLNTNGLRDAAALTIEPGLGARVVYVDANANGRRDPGEIYVTTASNGLFEMGRLAAGPVRLRLERVRGWRQSFPTQDQALAVIVVDGQTTTTTGFGVISVPQSSENTAPVLLSAAPASVRAGEIYRYEALASDVDGDAVAFQLVVKPDGMVVATNSGVVAWQPLPDQAGVHDVILRVQDGHGGVALQSFQITVLPPNSAPAITSFPSPTAVVGLPYRYLTQAQDAEGGSLTYSLAITPAGMAINGTNGLLSWTPTLSEIGSNLVGIVVTDAQGLQASQSFILNVLPSAPNHPPQFVGSPSQKARIQLPYVYPVLVTDSDGDPVSFTLVQAPVGAAIVPSTDYLLNAALLTWTPAPTQLGTNAFTLRASDGRGGVVDQIFSVVVASSLVNFSPLIVSQPSPAATVEQPYIYDASAEDADGDSLVWKIVSAPVGMSVDARSGRVRWTPAFSQTGTNLVTLEVQDIFQASARQSFSVTAGCANQPPQISSIPVTMANLGSPYLYVARGSDPEGDTVQWSLLSGPAGMTIDPAVGVVRWLPVVGQVGPHTVQIQLGDGRGGTAQQSFVVHVIDAAANRTPVITTTPGRGTTLGRPYVYQVRATDPDGDSINLGSLRLPDGATLTTTVSAAGSVEGTVTWLPSQTGSGEFIITARDSGGAVAAQRFLVEVRTNAAPLIASQPRTNGIPNLVYRYDVVAGDADGDALRYSLSSAPVGMSIDGLGRINWTPVQAQSGPHAVSVLADDGFGGQATQSFTVRIEQDVTPPVVGLTIGYNLVDAGGNGAVQMGTSVPLRVDAADNAGILSRTLFIGGTAQALGEDHSAMVAFGSPGIVQAVGQAVDLAGNAAWVTNLIPVVDPNAVGNVAIAIHSPTNSASVTRLVPIIATITSTAPLTRYSVEYAEIDFDGFHAEVDVGDPRLQFHSITNATLAGIRGLTNAVLGYFDPLALRNGGYLVRVTAYDVNQNGRQEGVLVGVAGNLKFGEFRLEFTDLQIPVAGIPITIRRVYDSRDSGRQGDFGHGWSMAMTDARILEVGKQAFTGLNAESSTFSTATRVYLNTPDGRRVGFSFVPEYEGGSIIFGAFYRPAFKADPGVYDLLEPLPADGGWQIDGRGRFYGGFGLVGYDPQAYRLTTKDGMVYIYDQDLGLQSMTDLNGNVLTFTRDAITHSLGQGIQFIRDAQGRITRIIDPNGKAIRYEYDTAGDLRSFSDQSTNTTRYLYHAIRTHYLTNIIDPFGKSALGLNYDENGRLASVTDALGRPLNQNFDAERNIGTFTDGRGNQTLVQYDDRGNETSRVVPGISTNRFAYDENNNLTNAVNARGFATNFVYDTSGNVTRIVDAQSNVTDIAYNNLGKPTFITNPLKQVLQLRYNPVGQLTEVINSLGFATKMGRDAQGRVTNVVDAIGNTNKFAYEGGCSCGSPDIVINPDGSSRRYEYNMFGQTTLEISELGAETRFNFDETGRLLWTQDALTNITRYLYDGPRLTHIVDALGRETRYLYDAFGRTNFIITAEGGTNELRYDANGNRTHVIDAVGNVTRFIYDAANRVTDQVDTFGRTNHFEYDAAGNRTEAVDRNGRRRTFAYDALDRMTNEIWWEGTNIVKSIVFQFNELGIQTFAADDVARYDYRFDSLNRLERVIQSAVAGQPDFTLLYTYTANGQVETVTDHWGVQVGSQYDARNRLKTRTWQGPSVDPARVDFGYLADGTRERTDRYADLAGANRVGFTTNAYSHAGIVTNITHLGPTGSVLAKYDYQFDAAYQIRQWTINNQLSTFDYDRTSQLTNALHAAQPDEAYRFDPNGNRVGAQSSGDYAVGVNNQILTDGTYGYGYDLEGSMTSRTNLTTGGTTHYAWDHRNRLVSVADRDVTGVVSQTLVFTYDAMNRRLSKTVNGEMILFLYNGNDSWADLDVANNVIARYLHGARIDELLARSRANDGRGWYLTDHLGTVRDIANAAGAAVAHVDYSSFGQVLGVTNPAALDRFLFTGRELDSETGLYFCRARYYIASLGRFINEDKIESNGSDYDISKYSIHDQLILIELNRFGYSLNNPLIFSDPSGHFSIDYARIAAVTGRAIVAFVAYGAQAGRLLLQQAKRSYEYTLGDSAYRSCLLKKIKSVLDFKEKPLQAVYGLPEVLFKLPLIAVECLFQK